MEKTKIDEEWLTNLSFKVISFLKKELEDSDVPPAPSIMLLVFELSRDIILMRVVERMVMDITRKQIEKQFEKVLEKIEEMRERPLRAIVTFTNQSNMECN